MSKVTHIGQPLLGWPYTQELLHKCQSAVPKEKQTAWVNRVATAMACRPDEIVAFCENKTIPPVSIYNRLMLAAVYAVEPNPSYYSGFTD